ncbi:MAG: NAD-dependent epimerase/dehydratase family protein [Lachnospiraceae bacterium]
MKEERILITGAAGFIGSFLVKRLLAVYQNVKITGLDNMNSYYDVSLKKYRLQKLIQNPNFQFIEGDLVDKPLLQQIFYKFRPNIIVNLAGQAGVRHSILHPDDYISSNVIGFYNILELCRKSREQNPSELQHLVYASSSSVYGANTKIPYSTDDRTDRPVSLYAATKKADELMAYSYSKLYGIPATGLRFFTVYGPEGRPDMAYFTFADKMVKGEKIQIYNYGNMYRDFTYIEDIVSGIIYVMGRSPKEDEAGVPHKIYNIGNNHPESLLDFVNILEKCLRREQLITCPVEKEFLPMQPGDVYQTYADISEMEHDFGFRPSTSLEEGLGKFVKWYKKYMGERRMQKPEKR